MTIYDMGREKQMGDLTNERLKSLDALRGFDMFFIMGGATLIVMLCKAFGLGTDSWLVLQMGHVAWNGLHHFDTIFPLFLFIAGASWPYSYAKQQERGMSKGAIALRCLRRGLVLTFLGLWVGGFFGFDFAHLRFWSVLGRIGLAWMIGAWLYMLLGIRARLAAAALILIASWLFFRFVPAPDAATFVCPESLSSLAKLGNGPFTPIGDFGCWVDRTIFGAHSYSRLYDPEGSSGFFPAIVTAMLGMFAGDWIRRANLSGNKKTLGLFAFAALSACGAWVLSFSCPIVKALWSPTFVLAVGCYSFAMLGAFYWIIDVKGFAKWSFPFQVIGLNSITIYLGQAIIGFKVAANFFFGGAARLVGEPWGSVITAAGYVLVCWLFLYFLYRKKTFLRV